MKREKVSKFQGKCTTTFKAGAISFAFLIIGYQVALFVHRSAVLKIEANRDRPDTVYVYLPMNRDKQVGLVQESSNLAQSELTTHTSLVSEGQNLPTLASSTPLSEGNLNKEGLTIIRKESSHSEIVKQIREKSRKIESFNFNPNTVSSSDLQRLGFSQKQAQAIVNYRQKGGRFRRKSDFAKSFVVSDSIYQRLEPFIIIPLLDINVADSAAFDNLPGIGPYFASQMVKYREQIGGYSSIEQLMDIPRFDRERLDGLIDLIECRPISVGDVQEYLPAK